MLLVCDALFCFKKKNFLCFLVQMVVNQISLDERTVSHLIVVDRVSIFTLPETRQFPLYM